MGLQDEIAKLVNSESAAHKRMVDYVLRQISADRPLSEILEDPYLTNRLTHMDRRAILEEPAVIEAVSDDVLNDMRRELEETLGGATHA
ncbi:MAG: hypothetical protein H6531_02130 [Actinobacteria bacterium]|nr:hypothetical protein [Thermoleophilia bacterium]MCB9010511.1 hypothetical protein [Actinomycetota bacterium]MCB9010611.1 hypothetical protein [Actinomycetota bacterium]